MPFCCSICFKIIVMLQLENIKKLWEPLLAADDIRLCEMHFFLWFGLKFAFTLWINLQFQVKFALERRSMNFTKRNAEKSAFTANEARRSCSPFKLIHARISVEILQHTHQQCNQVVLAFSKRVCYTLWINAWNMHEKISLSKTDARNNTALCLCVFSLNFYVKFLFSGFIRMSAMRKLDFLLHSIASSARNELKPKQNEAERQKKRRKTKHELITLFQNHSSSWKCEIYIYLRWKFSKRFDKMS